MVIADYVSDKKNLFRLNSGIFRIFELGLGNWNLDSSGCKAASYQFQILSDVCKIEFPWHWTKTFISPDSAWYIESIPIFKYKKFASDKKLWQFWLAEINLNIERISLIRRHSMGVLFSIFGPSWTIWDTFYILVVILTFPFW